MSATPPRDVPFGLRHAVTDSDRRFYASVYAILCATNVVAVLARTLLFAKIGVTAARHLFAAMLHSTLRSPTSFYDTTPIGRIVSRFAYDTELVDFVLITRVMNAVASFWWILCAIIILVAVAPWVALALVPVLVWYYFMQRFYRTSSRALQRLDSIRCAPAGVARVCVHAPPSLTVSWHHHHQPLPRASTLFRVPPGCTIHSSIQGCVPWLVSPPTSLLTVLPCVYTQHERRFVDRLEELIDVSDSCIYAYTAGTRWVGVRVELVGACILLAAAISCWLVRVNTYTRSRPSPSHCCLYGPLTDP